MGCIQSQSQRPPRKKKVSTPSTPTQEELEAARLLAAAKSQTPPKQAEPPRRETDVLRRAVAMDRAHEEALKSPSLQRLQVTPGDQTQRLLEGFALKEADAHAKPELRAVKPADLRESKLYTVLRGFEEKEERARSEPRLEKTFSERDRERSQLSLAGLAPISLSSENRRIHSLTTL